MRIAVLCCLLVLSACSSGKSAPCGEALVARDGIPRQVTPITDDLAALRQSFNQSADEWRVVALVSPTCSECVLGAEVVKREITSRYPSSQVAAIVIWIPMLATDNENAARSAATIFPPARAAQFYDSLQTVGTRYARETFTGFYERARKSLTDDHWLAQALDDRVEVKRPQWDLYMLYAPGARWEAGSDSLPMPTHWIRHLGRKEDRKTSTYWQDSPESGPREGDLYAAIRAMADNAIGTPRPRNVASSALKIEVLGFDDCPNAPTAVANVRRAVQAMGLSANVEYIDQSSLSEGDIRRGWPSPTILVDGRDLFGMPEPTAKASGCRLYEGGAPSEAKIAAAIRSIAR